MPNIAILAKFKRGVEPWNAWRQENPDLVKDLHKSTLSLEDQILYLVLNQDRKTVNFR